MREGAGREGELELERLPNGQTMAAEEKWGAAPMAARGRRQRPCEARPTAARGKMGRKRPQGRGSEGAGRSEGGEETRMDG